MIHRGATTGESTMIEMFGRVGQHGVWLQLPDQFDQGSVKLDTPTNLTVYETKKVTPGYSKMSRCRPLLRLSQFDQIDLAQEAVRTPLTAVGNHGKMNLGTQSRPFERRASGPELTIVGVGPHHEEFVRAPHRKSFATGKRLNRTDRPKFFISLHLKSTG